MECLMDKRVRPCHVLDSSVGPNGRKNKKYTGKGGKKKNEISEGRGKECARDEIGPTPAKI